MKRRATEKQIGKGGDWGRGRQRERYKYAGEIKKQRVFIECRERLK